MEKILSILILVGVGLLPALILAYITIMILKEELCNTF